MMQVAFTSSLAGLRRMVAVWLLGFARIRPWREASRALAARMSRVAEDGLATLRGEPSGRLSGSGSGAPGPDALSGARRDAEGWRARALDAEARADALERRLADAARDALELRSRNVCLQGKLAATSATARYHSLTQELGTDIARPEPASTPLRTTQRRATQGGR